MRISACRTRVLVFALLAGVCAGQTAPAPLDAKWTDLLTRLAADDFKTRDAAQKELSALPVSERPFLLRLAEQAADPEVKSRLLTRAGEMEESVAINPPPVSLNLNDAPLSEAFEELSKQTGLRIVGWPEWQGHPTSPLNKKISLKVEKQPLWAALQAIARQAPMSPMGTQEGCDLQFHLGAEGLNGASSSEGPVLIVLSQLLRLYRVTPGEKPADAKTHTEFTASIQALIDPRVRVSTQPDAGSLRMTEMRDDKGNSLLGPANLTGASVWWQDGGRASCSVPLQYPRDPGTRITFKGILAYTAEIRGSHVDLEFPRDKPVTASLEGMTITFKSFKQQNDQATVDVKVQRGSMALEKWKTILPSQTKHPMRFQLLDAKKNAIRSTGYGGSSGDQQFEYQFSYWLNRGKEKVAPTGLRIAVPTKVSEIRAPFEFKDIPMP